MSRKKKLEGSVQVIANHEWDPTLKCRDFVCLISDGDVPHIYEILELHPRLIIEHELFNNPSLLARGFKPGDELPPLLVIRRRRIAPGYHPCPPRHTIERKVDASKVVKVTLEQIRTVTDNLSSLAQDLLERESS